jgi:hypothetical protein
LFPVRWLAYALSCNTAATITATTTNDNATTKQQQQPPPQQQAIHIRKGDAEYLSERHNDLQPMQYFIVSGAGDAMSECGALRFGSVWLCGG